jgi:hypothetical protein
MIDGTSSGDDTLPSAVRSSRKIPTSSAFAMLERFLKSELERPDNGLLHHSSQWEDLYRISETLVSKSSEAAMIRSLRLSTPKLPTSQPMTPSSSERRMHEADDAGDRGIADTPQRDIEKSTAKEEKKRRKASKLEKKERKKSRQSTDN